MSTQSEFSELGVIQRNGRNSFSRYDRLNLLRRIFPAYPYDTLYRDQVLLFRASGI
jgi:hypothetical protein